MKITEQEKKEIVRQYWNCYQITQKDLSEKYGVSQSTVQKIVNWKKVFNNE